ncbi:hypothetical protein IGI04_040474 [Brassica rapa subsp. trilocularis]|uniref:Ubiquitin-like protease family profile domain-containing protein n=1 Tax=Brassica rapa subsp. trilocularis TaxID=1813537 RepID=A0ABQ7KMY2_BRACM|nr:hypothetical protein IGI04_040474 [Brassica rapa subsp. trilocularis]
MREGHEFKATDFRGGDSSLPPLKAAEKAEGVGVKKKCQKPFRRFGKACDEPGSSTQAPERPIRPRRGICKQAEPGNLSDKEQELKEWIRVELKTQLGKLRNEIFDWLHHDRGGSSTVPQNTAAGKTNRDNSHADPTGMEVPKKRRPFSGDGNDEAEIFGSDSKKHKKNNGDGLSDEETMRMHDNHCDGRTPNARFWKKVDSMAGEGPSFSKSAKIPEADVSTPIGPETVSKPAKPTLPEPLEVFSVDYQLFLLACEVYRNTDLFGQGEGGDGSPISGLNLLAEEVEKGTQSDNVYKDPQENTCRMLTVWSHPESYVLPPEEQGGKASPTNSEDYKTPPEDDPMTESRTPNVGNSKLSRYLTRSLKKAELGGKCIPISSTKKDDIPTKRIPRRSTKIGRVYTPDRRLKKLFQSCRKPKYTPLADLEIAQFQEFQSILRENPAQEFEIVIGIHVSNKFFLSLARPTNWVSTEHISVLIGMLVRRHGRKYLSGRCRFVDYFSIAGIISKFAEFEKASDKLGFNWGGLVSYSFTGKTRRRNDKKGLLVDVDRVYAPMMWGKDHWVGLVINLTCRQVEILDCNIPHNESDNEVNKHMAYLLRALPHVLAAFSPPSDSSHLEEDQAFSWVRPDNIYFNERSGDCGPCAVKFQEMHEAGYSYENMGQIDDKMVDIFRQKYAMDTYEEFIGNAKVSVQLDNFKFWALVYRKYSYTLSICILSVFVYRQYSNTVSIRIPSFFEYRQFLYTKSYVFMITETINCWISEGRSRKVISAIIARLCFQRCANDVQNSVFIVSGRRQAKVLGFKCRWDNKFSPQKTPTSDPNSMEAHVLPNLPQEIVCKIIELVGEESFYNLGPFLRAGKRGYALAHEPSVLKKCDVSEMEEGFVTCQIRQGCQFREFHLKCVSAGNRKAIYYEGLLTAPSIGLEESIKILEPNVPMHGFSTLAVAIFNVCLGNDKEASKDDTCETGESIENQLKAFGAEDLNCNKYGESFKFPDDGVIKTPRCVYGHDYADNLEGDCKNCRLFWLYVNIANIL